MDSTTSASSALHWWFTPRWLHWAKKTQLLHARTSNGYCNKRRLPGFRGLLRWLPLLPRRTPILEPRPQHLHPWTARVKQGPFPRQRSYCHRVASLHRPLLPRQPARRRETPRRRRQLRPTRRNLELRSPLVTARASEDPKASATGPWECSPWLGRAARMFSRLSLAASGFSPALSRPTAERCSWKVRTCILRRLGSDAS